MKISELIPVWEQKIRNAQGTEVASQIAAWRATKIPFELRPKVAALARRVGLYKYALLLLRADFLAHRESPLEYESLIAEYAATLSEIGATKVAERLLAKFTHPTYEMTPFYRALLWMKMWRYDLVPQEIETFKRLSRDSYRLDIADVNLASALILQKQYDSARVILEQFEGRQNLSPMLQGVVDEQFGQLLFFTGERGRARDRFVRSFERLKATGNPSALYAEKWILLIDLQEKPWIEVEPRWIEFRERVEKAGFWEVMRELERFLALRTGDPDLLSKLYFGSPFEGYRKIVCRDSEWVPPEDFLYLAVGHPHVVFDTRTLKLMDRREDGKTVRLPLLFQRLLLALSRDLYRPIAVGSLFEALYPDEYFHPRFASQRVYKVIARFRALVKKQKIPIEIEASELGFRLAQTSNFAILYRSAEQLKMAQALKTEALSMLEKHFGSREFSASEASNLTGIPKRSVNRVLSSELEVGTIASSGQGKNTRYRILAQEN